MDRIEQAATVAGGVVLSVTPKVAFGSTQDRAGDGVPTWMAQSAAGWPERRDLAGWCRVGRQLRNGLAPSTRVELVGFEVAVVEKESRDGRGVDVPVLPGRAVVRDLLNGLPPAPS